MKKKPVKKHVGAPKINEISKQVNFRITTTELDEYISKEKNRNKALNDRLLISYRKDPNRKQRKKSK